MDVWAAVAIAVILGSIIVSLWRRLSYAILGTAACIIVFGLTIATNSYESMMFMPRDLVDPGYVYTVLTSMYAHAQPSAYASYGLWHLLFNLIGLLFLGIMFEQRVGTKPFIVIYLLSGLAGTLAFAAFYWNEPFISVLGASGAISGVLGAYARLFPREKVSMMIMFLPLPPLPIWQVVGLFVLLQFFFVTGSGIAWQAHLSGLVAGILLAPVVVRLFHPQRRVVRKSVSVHALRKLATTPQLRTMLDRIEAEELPEVRSAWISEFLSRARCPICGAQIRVSGDGVRCSRGHLL